MILLPAIDIRGGRAVRLERGDFARETVYGDDPLEAARTWVEEGARALHVVDLDGAREGEPRSLGHLERIAGLGAEVEYGGGLRTFEAVEAAFAAGADRVVLGTAAFRDEALLDRCLEGFGERVAVGVDVRGGRVSVAAWTEEAAWGGEEAIVALRSRGVETILYTSVDRDGMLEGPDLDEVRRVSAVVGDGRLVYSGGIAAAADLEGLRALGLPNLVGVISGKALYERRFTVAEGRRRFADMALTRVIPCLDVKDGRVVKGTRFVGLRDAGDPVELAARYEAEGGDEIVFLDITASSDKRATIVDLARRTADEVFVPFTIGGGVRTVRDAQAVLDAGADKVSVNSAAVARPGLLTEVAETLGSQALVLAIDARRAGGGYEVFVDGGRTATGPRGGCLGAGGVERGAGEILLTSMDRDGTEDGYELELTRRVSEAVGVPVIASGGAGDPEHLVEAVERGRADAVLCASIFHYGQYSVGEAKARMREAGIAVR